MKNTNRVRWSEMRDESGNGNLEQFYWIAEKTPSGWTFYEREAYELRWYPVPSSERLVSKAIAESARQAQQQQSNFIPMLKVA